MTKQSGCGSLFTAISLLLAWQPAASQELAANETVADRKRPELDAIGIAAGSFRLFPQLDISAVRDSNVFATDGGEISDEVYAVEPRVELESDWGNHALAFGAEAAIRRYDENDREDHEDYSVFARGRLDIDHASFLEANLEHNRRHEDRDSPDDARGLERTEFDIDSISVSYQVRPQTRRLYARLEGEYGKFDFRDSASDTGLINNDDRDRRELSGTVRIGYAVMPTYSLFLRGASRSVEYDDLIDDDGFQRDFDSHEASLGLALSISNSIFGDIFVGYRTDAYADGRFADSEGATFGADMAWNLSGLTTVSLSARRSVEATTIADASAVEATRFGLGVDHELLRNLILSLNWSTVNEEFLGIPREDDIDTIRFTARYLMNRRVELVFAYAYRDRDTEPADSTGLRFSRNLAGLTLKIHL